MRICFFGKMGDVIGREVEIEIPASTATVAGLRRLLAEHFPAAAGALGEARLRACIADAMVNDSHSIAGVERVEFFPPLSGG
ncbi:MoaD/ThiS family protein [Sphingorhabdus soli]|uniref:MoaD/ThiS family protein n=2 Tax=Flavisphingopyxis soli TaxID=2601267 RepID=A0A5C6U5D5_9SPHN|nr:MoaD/ThiS family protein [Sphingorhabdus soli]